MLRPRMRPEVLVVGRWLQGSRPSASKRFPVDLLRQMASEAGQRLARDPVADDSVTESADHTQGSAVCPAERGSGAAAI